MNKDPCCRIWDSFGNQNLHHKDGVQTPKCRCGCNTCCGEHYLVDANVSSHWTGGHTSEPVSCATLHSHLPDCSGSKRHHLSDFHLHYQNQKRWSHPRPELGLHDLPAHLQLCMVNSRLCVGLCRLSSKLLWNRSILPQDDLSVCFCYHHTAVGCRVLPIYLWWLLHASDVLHNFSCKTTLDTQPLLLLWCNRRTCCW